MKIRKLNPRERLIATVTTVTLGIGIAYVYAIEPVYLQWRAAHDDASAAIAELSELRALVVDRNEIEEQFARFAGAVPRGPSREALEVRLLKEIEQVASAAGVRVTTLKPLSTRGTGPMQRISVEMHGACAANNYMSLLQKLQEPAHVFTAEAITLEAGRDDPPLSVTMTLTKLVYIDANAKSPETTHD